MHPTSYIQLGLPFLESWQKFGGNILVYTYLMYTYIEHSTRI